MCFVGRLLFDKLMVCAVVLSGWAAMASAQAEVKQATAAPSSNTAPPSNAGSPEATLPGLVATPLPTPAVPIETDPLVIQIDEAIRINSQRFLVANHNSPWQIYHGLLAYRRDFMLRVGNEKMSAIDWIATHEPKFDGQPLLLITSHGAKFHPYNGHDMAFEGHPSQGLALLSESHLPVDFAFKIGDKQVTIGDMLQNSMMELNSNEEITWVLWALVNYLKTDAQWVNQWGQAWSIEQLVAHQVRASVENGACGGNHGLFVLVRARDKYLKTGKPLRGAWFEADQKIQRYLETARQLQNADGSFSAEFYRKRGYTNDMNERFNTTGHTFEFVSVALPESRLNEPWVRNAAAVLARELIAHRRDQPSCGPLYHSCHSLINYRARLRPMSLLATNPVTRQNFPPVVAEAKPAAAAPTVVPAPAAVSIPVPVVTSPAVVANPTAVAGTPAPALQTQPTPVTLPAPLEVKPKAPELKTVPEFKPTTPIITRPTAREADMAPPSALQPANVAPSAGLSGVGAASPLPAKSPVVKGPSVIVAPKPAVESVPVAVDSTSKATARQKVPAAADHKSTLVDAAAPRLLPSTPEALPASPTPTEPPRPTAGSATASDDASSEMAKLLKMAATTIATPSPPAQIVEILDDIFGLPVSALTPINR